MRLPRIASETVFAKQNSSVGQEWSSQAMMTHQPIYGSTSLKLSRVQLTSVGMTADDEAHVMESCTDDGIVREVKGFLSSKSDKKVRRLQNRCHNHL